jgi:hypothetical protein
MNHLPSPSASAQRLLHSVLPQAMADAFLGDLEEQFQQLAARRGAAHARRWYWQETLLSLPRLTLYAFEIGELRRLFVTGPSSARQPIWGTAFSLLLLLPALLIVIPGLLFNLTGVDLPAQLGNLVGPMLKAWIDNPWIILGGLLFALAINTLAVARLKFEENGEAVRLTVEVRKRIANLVLLALTLFLGISIFFYLIAENLLPLA